MADGKKSWFKKIDTFFKKLGTEPEPTPKVKATDGGKQLGLLKAEKREEMQKQREKVIALKEQLNALDMAARCGETDGAGDRRKILEGKALPVEPGLPQPAWMVKKHAQLEEELTDACKQLSDQGKELMDMLAAAKKLPGENGGANDDGYLYGWEIDPGEWKCLKKLGEGEFGITYQGEFRGKVVAVKRLKLSFPNPKIIEESKQELRLLSYLRHPNVVLFMGACTVPEEFCVVTELMEGGSLFDILHKQQKHLDKWIIMEFAKDIAYGMAYLHAQDPPIIHRDLKSGNLLVNKQLYLKIADFGLARAKAESGVMTAETGSYRWMAPEVIRHEKYNEKVDVYSFALVLWEMITGSMPFIGYTPVQAAMAVARQGARPPIPSTVTPRMAALIERCWANNPADRPPFEEVITMLNEIEKEMLVEAAKGPGGRAAKSY